ncbi:MAG: co-chaperone GroES [bacterium]
MNFKPLHSNVVIKPIDKEAITKSGIVLPDTANNELSEQGEVVAVGTGRIAENGQVIPMSVKVGDKIMFKNGYPHEIKIDNQDYLVIKEEDILLILE